MANPELADELLATKKISKHFPATPAEECIHVIVEPPVQIASSSREQELLDRLASLENNRRAFFSLKIQIDTVQKPFSDWKLGKVCELLGLAPGIDEFPTFDCGIDKLDSEKAKDLMSHLYKDLRLRCKAIHGETEATTSPRSL
ncbi:9292_t:CDS:2 [Paraglomus occultum]|uniref:9292_t:CDS:1 n=1 Tax=Paraglomus occultum TaxID=144539 RepID=A0A9N9E129_9GLOM|nr:9292_t:CDS:2 [Paraglomus occultum]